MKISRLIGFVSALAISGAAPADEAFRCGKWVVTSSATLSELVAKCGEPATRESRTEDVRVLNANTGHSVKVGETLIETWTFDRGTQAAAMVATIVDGQIKSLERRH
jgi:uncharacterized protein DUF2845